MPVNLHDRDLLLWRQWSADKTAKNLSALLSALGPLIQSEVNKWGNVLPRGVMEIHAKKLAVEAIKTFSPARGARLSTHVMGRLRKLSRLVYTHQNAARIPEYQNIKFTTFSSTVDKLRDRLGREPTAEDLSAELAWSKSAVARMRRSIRREFVESGDPVNMFDNNAGDEGIIAYIYHDLSPEHKIIFEHTTGYGGAQILNNAELRRKLGYTQGKLSYNKRLVVDDVVRKVGYNANYAKKR